MISNNLVLLSQNKKTIAQLKNNKQKSDYSTNPQKRLRKSLLNARIAQSHENLFNFVNDTFNY